MSSILSFFVESWARPSLYGSFDPLNGEDPEMSTACPICGDGLQIQSDAFVGELVDCAGCEAELEVVRTQPALVLEEAPMDGEDWGE